MTSQTPDDRCRLVLIALSDAEGSAEAARVVAALDGGDVASLILVQGKTSDTAFQDWAAAIVPAAQARGAAVIVAGDSRVAGRVGADGIHLETSKQDIADAVERHAGRLIIGTGGTKTRHDALELGETQPDYMFFGRFGYDTVAEPHPRNIDLAEWWASMVEIPCIVLGGSDIASVEPAAATGAEFVALSAAVFAPGIEPAAAVAEANRRLDATAPRLAS